MSRLLVSICVPTYNRAAALAQSLPSILQQDYEPLEILISDNCSQDDTEKICCELQARDSRVRYYRHPRNLGLYGNHNFCINASHGEFLCFFHDHDERNSRLVSEYASFMLQHPEVGVVCSDWDLIDEFGAPIGTREYNVPAVASGLEYIEQTLRSGRSSVGAPGAMIRRSALGDIRFSETGPVGFGDFPVWFRLAERSSVGHIHQRLWRWRQQSSSQSARTIESMALDYYKNLTDYCDAYLVRWPGRADRVARWKRHIRQYLFWALVFEVGLYYRKNGNGQPHGPSYPRTVFEILNYQLGADAFHRAVEQLQHYRTGAAQHAAFFTVKTLMRLGLTKPLAWATYHHSTFRILLGLQ